MMRMRGILLDNCLHHERISCSCYRSRIGPAVAHDDVFVVVVDENENVLDCLSMELQTTRAEIHTVIMPYSFQTYQHSPAGRVAVDVDYVRVPVVMTRRGWNIVSSCWMIRFAQLEERVYCDARVVVDDDNVVDSAAAAAAGGVSCRSAVVLCHRCSVAAVVQSSLGFGILPDLLAVESKSAAALAGVADYCCFGIGTNP